MTTDLPGAPQMFVVRARRQTGGRWAGIVERARTGEKRRFDDVDEIGRIIESLLDADNQPRQEDETP